MEAPAEKVVGADSARSLIEAMSGLESMQSLVAALGSGASVAADGLWGASSGLALAALGRSLGVPILIVAQGPEEADLVADDLAYFSGRHPIEFPAWDILPTEADVPEIEPTSARLAVCRLLAEIFEQKDGAVKPPIMAASVQALLQPVPGPETVRASPRTVRVGDAMSQEELSQMAAELGCERVASVEVRGEFAVRGGIVDLFPLVSTERLTDDEESPEAVLPYRVEFLGDKVESIRTFDPGSQRTVAERAEIELASIRGADVRTAFDSSGGSTLIDHLPPQALVVLVEPEEIQARAKAYLGSYRKGSGLVEWEELWRRIGSRRRLDVRPIAGDSSRGVTSVEFEVRSAERFTGEIDAVLEEMRKLIASGTAVTIMCDNEAERDRLTGILREGGLEPGSGPLLVSQGRISAGFEIPKLRMARLSDHEIFGRYRHRRRIRKREHTRALSDVLELEPGDYVVHASHGVARYLHMKTIDKGDRREDYLTLMFHDDVRLYVPASHIHLVHKYVGMKGARPKLSHIGGKAWVKRRAKVESAVRDIAEDLIATQAARKALPGITYPPDGEWQERFEAAFIYEETPDQLSAADAIRKDMQSPYPMDRLLCGDVGFGKTEVAIRGAFRAVNSGRQVAVLVPTTVLAEQHYTTFRERLADYPVVVESLSRFRTKGEQREIIKRLAAGRVDIVIGTHRLLQSDIAFRDLGLVIIDEEQRFGVEHKERLKQLRVNVDVLTLTATPIPRTLHMALVGIRDIASLTIAPEDRLSIRTKVCRRDHEIIRRAILREMHREGQVFFLHNRVASIVRVADEISRLVPEARVIHAHGQMPEGVLAERMASFIRGEADVLVATTIIENGIDIPRANTMFIDSADTFGLSELHQLRGRVGRYKHRAYAYLMIDGSSPMTMEARKRLKAIEEFDELGAGFRLAMRDMEIRGAGNVLGPEQSGHIAEVGYDLYCRLLEDAVRRHKGAPPRDEMDVTVFLDAPAYVPADYVTDEPMRLELYRRIAAALGPQDIQDLRVELKDRYGQPPEAVGRLLAEGALRLLAKAAWVPYIGVEGGRLAVKLHGWNAQHAADRIKAIYRDARFPDDHTFTLPLEGEGYPARLTQCESALKKLGALLESEPGLRGRPRSG